MATGSTGIHNTRHGQEQPYDWDGFRIMWPWPLTFWPMGQCMQSDCYRVYVYKVWCW